MTFLTYQKWKLEVDSKDGKGSRFYFTLKMKIEFCDEERNALPEFPILEGKEKPLKILLAEDVKENRSLIEAYLKDTVHSLESVENGEKEIPVLAFTAHALKEEVDECLQAGCTSLLAKPLKKNEFIKRVHSYSRKPNPPNKS